MPVNFSLLENERVIRFDLSEPWTTEQLMEVQLRAKEHFDKATQPIYLIADVSKIHSVPPNIFRIRESASMSHPNRGNITVIGAPALVKTMSEAIFRISKFHKASFFRTEDEALAHVRKLLAEEGTAEPETR